ARPLQGHHQTEKYDQPACIKVALSYEVPDEVHDRAVCRGQRFLHHFIIQPSPHRRLRTPLNDNQSPCTGMRNGAVFWRLGTTLATSKRFINVARAYSSATRPQDICSRLLESPDRLKIGSLNRTDAGERFAGTYAFWRGACISARACCSARIQDCDSCLRPSAADSWRDEIYARKNGDSRIQRHTFPIGAADPDDRPDGDHIVRCFYGH